MPILTKSIIHNFRKNQTTQANMEKLNLIYPFATDIEIPILDLKLISPKRADIHIECECDLCGRKFKKTLLRTELEDIKNNYVVCNVCHRTATNQKKFGRDYIFFDPEEFEAAKELREKNNKKRKDS